MKTYGVPIKYLYWRFCKKPMISQLIARGVSNNITTTLTEYSDLILVSQQLLGAKLPGPHSSVLPPFFLFVSCRKETASTRIHTHRCKGGRDGYGMQQKSLTGVKPGHTQ